MKPTLDFIKAHAVALTWGVVALLAIIAYFVWPVPTKFQELQSEVEARKQTWDSVNSLSGASRTLPAFDPTSPEPKPLDRFPTKQIIAEGQKAVQQVKDRSKSVLDAAVNANKRPLLVDNVLPNPTSFTRGEFLDRYRRETAQYGENAEQGIVRKILRGTLPPTPDELAAVEAQRAQQIRKEYSQVDARGNVQNQADVDAQIQLMRSRLPLEQRVGRALNYRIYVSPGGVEVHRAMETIGAGNLTAVQIFNAQFSLWLQQTVLEAIAETNKNATSVLDAPIKHLVQLRVPMDIADPATTGGVGFGQPSADAPAGPVALTPDASVTLTPNYTQSPLGYASNAMFDPINVQLVLRVDAARLPETLASLSSGRMIKIRNVNYRTVDAGVALSQGYFYSRDGSAALVEVELDCDVLMLRSWVVPYMPDPVKAVFNALANPAQPAQ